MIELVYFSDSPPTVEIMQRPLDGLADIRMRQSIEQSEPLEEGGAAQFTAEEVYFAIPILNAPSESTIQGDWSAWWKVGAWYGVMGDKVRNKRDGLLDASDYLLALDYSISDADRAAVIEYRQELRDITDNYESPDTVIWPDKPNVKQGGHSIEQIIEQIVGEV
ncbi:hypothetical protein FACS18948_6620 [Clostridia bacterium]|nr:hypothetical protein FACS18948_6620 [Clostridia bacterium]